MNLATTTTRMQMKRTAAKALEAREDRCVRDGSAAALRLKENFLHLMFRQTSPWRLIGRFGMKLMFGPICRIGGYGL